MLTWKSIEFINSQVDVVINEDVEIRDINNAESCIGIETIKFEGELSISNCCLETILARGISVKEKVRIDGSAITNLIMDKLKTKSIFISKSCINNLHLEDAEFQGNIYIDKETTIRQIFLRGAKYDYLSVDNISLAIAAYLSREGIIIPACEEKYNWLIQGMVRR